MSDSAQDRPTRGPEPPANDRLESWKEIAAYLDKGVSTVQRWERDASLPVYRHSQGNVLNVYASRSELDAWRNHPGMPPDEGHAGHTLESAPLVPAAPRGWGRLVAGAGVVVVAVAVGASVWPAGAPSLDFEARDWVLIADFENQTGGAIAEGTRRVRPRTCAGRIPLCQRSAARAGGRYTGPDCGGHRRRRSTRPWGARSPCGTGAFGRC